MKKRSISMTLVIVFFFVAASWASLPVNVTITGCVKEGILISEKTDFGTHVSKGIYKIKPLHHEGKQIDLSPYEGKRINIVGDLLPGDRFYANKESMKVVGECVAKSEYDKSKQLTIEEQEKLARELYAKIAKTDEWELETFIKLHRQVIDQCPDAKLAQESLWRLSNLYLITVDPPDHQKIIELMEQIITKYPDSPLIPDAKNRLLIAYEQTGNFKKAVAIYEDMLARDPSLSERDEYADVLLGYAKALAESGDKEKARKNYQEVIDLDKNVEDWLKDIARDRLLTLDKKEAGGEKR